MSATINQKLCMSPTGRMPVIHVGQYDSDFSIVFSLYSVGSATWTMESGTTAKIRGTKTDGTGYSANCTVDVTNKKVTVAGDQQMTAAAGDCVYEIVLYKGTKELSSVNFILKVERAAMDAETIPSESKIQEIQEIGTKADEIIEAYENLQFDETPTANSTHAVKSGGIKTYVDNATATDSTLSLANTSADAKATGDALSLVRTNLSEALELGGENLISLSDFSAHTGVSVSVDSSDNSITVSTTSSGTYRCAQTSDSFIPTKLTVGKRYRLHVRAYRLSGNKQIIAVIRGVNGNANGIATSKEIPDGGEVFIDFTPDEYMQRVTLMITFNSSGSASVKFSDIWLKEYNTTGIDEDARLLISQMDEKIDQINEKNGLITNFGDSWSRTSGSGYLKIIKNENEFTFYGTVSGSNRFSLLSYDTNVATQSTVANFDQSLYTIDLKPDTDYKMTIELVSGEAMVPSSSSEMGIYLKAYGASAVSVYIDLKSFAESSVQEARFTTDSTDTPFALMVREVSGVTYSGTYRFTIKEMPDLKELATNIDDLKEQDELLESLIFSTQINHAVSTSIGGIDYATGRNENATKRARDNGSYFSVTAPTMIRKSDEASGYYFAIMRYEADVNSTYRNYNWITADKIILYPDEANPYKIRFQFTKADNTTVTTDDLSVMNNMLSFHQTASSDTDSSLCGESNAVAATRGYIAAGNTAYYLPAFVHVTDIHGDSVRFDRAMKFAKRIGAKGVFGTGDFVDYLTNAASFDFVVNAVNKYNVPFYPCNGNHEQISNTQAEESAIIFQPLQAQGGYTLANVTNPTYWHKDLEEDGIRLIAVNQFEDSSSQWIYDMSQNQVNWFCEVLNGTPEGYGIIVLEHAAETNIVRSQDVFKFCQKETHNPYSIGTIVSDIVDAYISGTTIYKTYNPQSDSATSGAVTVNYSFVNKSPDTEFIAFASGHYHMDLVHFESNRTNKMLNLNACATSQAKAVNLDLARVEGTETQDAFNVYVIDRDRKKVKVVRVGSHLTYDFAVDRDYLEISYA